MKDLTLPPIPLPAVDLMMSELGPRMVAYYQPVADAPAGDGSYFCEGYSRYYL